MAFHFAHHLCLQSIHSLPVQIVFANTVSSAHRFSASVPAGNTLPLCTTHMCFDKSGSPEMPNRKNTHDRTAYILQSAQVTAESAYLTAALTSNDPVSEALQAPSPYSLLSAYNHLFCPCTFYPYQIKRSIIPTLIWQYNASEINVTLYVRATGCHLTGPIALRRNLSIVLPNIYLHYRNSNTYYY